MKINNAAHEQEMDREQQMIDRGRQRYLKRQEGLVNEASQNSSQRIINGALVRVSEAIRKTIETQEASKSRNPCWYSDVVGLDVDLLAYIALNTCMESVSTKATLTSCVSRIGRRIELEHWSAGLLEHDRTKARRIETQVSGSHSSSKYRIKAARITASRDTKDAEGTIVSGYKVAPWLPSRIVKAAGPLINAVLEYSGIFDVWEKSQPKNTVKKIGMTAAAQAALADMDYEASWLEPMFGPMLCPPTPWTKFDTGCYRDARLASEVSLVRMATNEQRMAMCHAIKKAGPEGVECLEALNAIQATPLAINKQMLELVRWAWYCDISIEGFPTRNQLPKPRAPGDWGACDAEAKKGYALQCRETAESNRDTASQTVVMSQDLATAIDLSNFDEFYLPWNLDFRGRCYPVPHFNYHRDDHMKSLFELRRTQPMDQDGASYLAIHIANLGDFDRVSKKSFQEREQWTSDNTDWLLSLAADYKGTVAEWSEADKPFQFMAAVFAWAKWIEYGVLYHCPIPCSLDGANNGLQHYSAASLDEDDGAEVNLTPSDAPRDIYQKVADMVHEVVSRVASDYAHEHREVAQAWLAYGITRKVCKRNTMTYAYSSVVHGMGDQLIEDIMTPLSKLVLLKKIDQHPFGFGHTAIRAARFLAKINMDCIRAVVTSAQSGMEFLRSAAGALAHEGKPVRWTTPIGFIAIQKYTEYETKKVKIFLYDRATHQASLAERKEAELQIAQMDLDVSLPDLKTTKRTQLTVRERSKTKINKRKSKSSIAPNFIHGLDSAHLMKTVLRCKDSGVQDFFLIHDSFASTPNMTSLVYAAVRETFVEMYDGRCVYTEFYTEVRQQLSVAGRDKLDLKVPPKGTLDLQGILKSEYCFS
jgi:DNA-directed RNA polymerase